MAITPVAVEFGMGTDLQGGDHTKAAIRALKDALWHNSLNMADAFGFPRESMLVHVIVGVAQPANVNKAAIAAVLPYGTATVEITEGGLDIPSEDGSKFTVIANVAATVSFDMERAK